MKLASKITFILFYMFLSLTSKPLYGQEQKEVVEELILLQKNNNYAPIEEKAEHLKDRSLKSLVLADLYYHKSGLIVDNIGYEDKSHENRSGVMYNYLYADYLKRKESGKDSLIFELYRNAFTQASILKDSLLSNEVLRRINRHLLRNGSEIKSYQKYVLLAKAYAQDSIDHFWYYYNKAGYEMRKKEKYPTEISEEFLTPTFDKGFSYATNPYLKGYLQQFKGIFLVAYLKKNQEGLVYYNLAEANYLKDSLYYSSKGLKSLRFNKAIIYRNLEEYNKAIPLFKDVIATEKNKVYLMYGYDWLYQCYDGLKQHDSAYHYFKKMVATKDKLSQLGHALDISEIETKYDLEAKEEELQKLAIQNKTLFDQLGAVIPIVIVLLVLGGFLLYFYRRTKMKNISLKEQKLGLEEEKVETIKQLEELKKIVKKDFIVLKDKTKVYVSELIYIKSDDHFLRVYTSDGKSNFVRGRLSQINEELPPNFKRTHRSYIVNENYIKQVLANWLILKDKTEIPISKSYKKYFEDF